MLPRLSAFFHRRTRGWLVLVLLFLDGVFMGFVMPLTGALLKGDSGGPAPIDLQFFYTPARVYEMVAAYGEFGRAFYRNVELTADIIYPIVYTLFLSLLISWLFQRGFPAGSRLQRLNVVPFGGWLFDLLENLGIVAMLSIYPATPAALAWLTALFTLVKWLFAGASMVLVLVGLVAAIRNGFRKQAPIAA